MRYILSAALLAATITSGAQQVFHDADAQVRNVGSFHTVQVSSAIELQLSQGPEDAVAVSIRDKDRAGDIKTEVKDGHLRIWYAGKGWLKNTGRIRAYVSAKSLDGIEADGASEVVVNGTLNASSLALKMSGASDFKGEVKANALDISLSGASDLKIRGSAANLKVDASGASNLKGYDFIADNCLINASGASDVKLTANKVINAEASGASTVSYKGSGQEGKIKSSGASNISRKG